MFNRFFGSVMIVTSAFTIIIGQTPEAQKEKAPAAPQTFAFSFDGDGGYLGVQTTEVSKENFAKFGLREVRGVAVEKVLENSPAAAAGIQAGDVIVRFNSDEITSSRKLTRLVSEVSPDHQVTVTVVRGGREQQITVTVGKRPAAEFGDGNFKFEMPPMSKIETPEFRGFDHLKDLPQLKVFPKLDGSGVWTSPDGNSKAFTWRSGEGRQIGIGVDPLTKQLAQHFGVDGGVMINDVRENSPAAKAGLKAGDIIVDVNGKAVKGDFDLIREINGKKEGDVQLTIVRDGKRQTISVTPEASKDGGFMFKTDGEDGMSLLAPPVAPARVMTGPMTPRAAPAPMKLFRPGRII